MEEMLNEVRALGSVNDAGEAQVRPALMQSSSSPTESPATSVGGGVTAGPGGHRGASAADFGASQQCSSQRQSCCSALYEELDVVFREREDGFSDVNAAGLALTVRGQELSHVDAVDEDLASGDLDEGLVLALLVLAEVRPFDRATRQLGPPTLEGMAGVHRDVVEDFGRTGQDVHDGVEAALGGRQVCLRLV
jgi:hypothetical protein